MSKIIKIVITGGPCAGKSSAMSRIKKAFHGHGFTVLFVPETATELITGGVAPWTCGTCDEYQELQMKLQLVKEDIFRQAAETMTAEKILIVCDRGMLDNKAYMTSESFERIAYSLGLSESQLIDSYEAVFHLVTAADGAIDFYTTENNCARTETPEEAIVLDRRLISAWSNHPYFKVIDNSTDFENKLRRLIEEISSFLDKAEI